MPSAVAATASASVGHDSVVTAWSVPASARAAAPDARRTCSADGPSSPAGPSPTATTSGAVTVPAGRDLDDLVRAAGRARDGEQRRQLAVERGVHGGRARGEPGRRLLTVVAGTGGQDADHERVRGGRRGSGPGTAQQMQLGACGLLTGWGRFTGSGCPRP